ncbi:MAG TPA: hypothetical protein V6C84_15600 [Coleofasciculaceae cyanobacterium]|jgi:hypothetical protein
MKFANPLYYPVPMLISAIALVVGVRMAKLPNWVILPGAGAIAVAGAALRKSQEPKSLNLEDPLLERELLSVRQQARLLAEKATELRAEAARLLADSLQMDLLASVQMACDRATELPQKIDALTQRIQGNNSLLSVEDLRRQLAEVQTRLSTSSGLVKEQLDYLVESLQHNIHLVQTGEDTRQAQVASLSTLILDSAGVLQAMQNKLRSTNLADVQQTLELRSLSDELSIFQENVDLLVSQSSA